MIAGSQACGKQCRYTNQVVSQTPSPNGKLKAVVFNKFLDEENSPNCPGGNAISGVESLSILPIDAKPPVNEKTGNVIDDDHLTVEWISDSELSVTGDHDAGDKPLPVINGVTVNYKKNPKAKN